MSHPLGPLLAALRRRVLVRTALRSSAMALLCALGAVMLSAGVEALGPAPHPLRLLLDVLPFVALGWIPLALLRVRSEATDHRLALLADERGGHGNVATTLLSANVHGPVAGAFRRRATETVRSIDATSVVPLDAGRLWGALLLATVVSVPLLLVMDGTGGSAPAIDGADGSAAAATAPDPEAELPTVGSVTFTVTPPAYTGLPLESGGSSDRLAALPGSTIELRGTGTARPPELSARVVGGAALRPVQGRSGWSAEWVVRPDDRGVRLDVERGGTLVDRRVVPLQPLRDRAPTVRLDEPVRDLVLATATGTIPVRASAEDDFGVDALELHWVRSRGSGESFDFDEGVWAWDDVVDGADGRRASRTLRLEELGLEPGDVLHVRAVALDANDVTGPGVGVSPTRQIRISREDDLSDVTTIIGFPIERDREPLLSQRMIILLTEELLERASSLDGEALLREAAEVADEQARLRSRIGEQIFSRATGAMQDPEAHLEFEHGEEETVPDLHRDLPGAPDPPGHTHAEESVPVIDPETGLASIADVDLIGHDHDSDPIIAINQPLLTIYNYMWDAERMLREGSLDPSLLPQNLALDEMQRLREAERVFVRGRVSVRPIDVPGTRGTGEVDDADPSRRSPTPPAAGGARVAAEIQALLAASPVRTGRATAVRISDLALDVLEGAGDPAAAASLAEAADRAADDDPDGTVLALRDALRTLRAAGVRTASGGTEAPVSYAEARYLAAGIGRDEGAPVPSEDEAAPPPFVFATVRYASGDWDSAPLVPTNLIHALAQYTELPVAPDGVIVDLSSPEIFDYPFLYLTGHLPVFFGDAESRNLVDYVERGGFVFIDDHNHDIDGAFHRSVTTELQRLFGTDALREVPNDHELYSAFFVFDDGPPITGHELSGWGDGLIHRHLQQVEMDGRIAVLYSNKDYSSEWSYHAENKRFLAVDNTRFGVNILVYALTR